MKKNINKSESELLKEINKLKAKITDLEKDKDIFHLIAENTSDGIAIVSFDLKARYLYVSPSSIHLLGYEPEEMIGKSFFEFVHPDDKKQSIQLLKKYLKEKINQAFKLNLSNVTETLEYRIKSKSGEWCIFQSTINVMGNKLITVSRDITEKKKSDNALRDSEEKYRTIIEGANDGIIHVNKQIEVVMVNDAFTVITGIPKEDVIGKSGLNLAKKFVNKKQLPEILRFISSIFSKTHTKAYELDFKEKTLEISAKNQESGGIVGIIRDITPRKQAQKALQKNEKELEIIFQGVKNGIALVDKNGIIIRINNAIVNISGYAEKEFIGKHFSELKIFPTSSINKVQKNFNSLMKGDYVNPYEIEVYTKKGEKKIVLFHSSILKKDDKIDGTIIILRDITQKWKSEQTQEVLNNIVKAINTTKSLDELYQTIHNLLSSIIKNSNFYIALIDKEKNHIAFPYFVDEKNSNPGFVPRENSKSLTEYVIKTGIPLFATKKTYQNLAKQGEIKLKGDLPEIWIGIPLCIEKNIIGVMALQDYHEANTYNENDLELLTHISYQIAFAIEKKKTEQINLRLSEVIRNSTDGVILTDTKGKINYVNPAFEKMSGYNLSELIDIDPADLIVYNDDSKISGEKLRAEAMSKGEWKRELICKRKNNELYPIETRVFAIKNDKGETVEIAGIQQDITERKQTELALKESEEKFRELANFLPQVVYEVDLKGNLTFSNKQAFSTFGYSQEDFDKGINIFQIIVPEDRERGMKNIQDILKGIEPANHEYMAIRKDGSKFPVLIYSSAIYKNGSPLGLRGIIVDITQQKLIEKELIKAKEKSEESDRLKSSFLANMSHEIRTPMNGILGFTNLLKENNLSGDEQKQFINIIEKSGVRMLKTINDIIDISKIESGQTKITITDTNINRQMENLFLFFKPEVEKKGMTISLNTAFETDKAIIKTDKDKLYGILTNLIKNAIKFSHKGSIEFGYNLVLPDSTKQPIPNPVTLSGVEVYKESRSAELSVTERSRSAEVEFYIKDTGIGIPKNRQQAVFDRFVQADIDDKEVYEGSGLGLAITKAYVEMLGGEIWLESEEGVGTTFYFTLPYSTDKKDIPIPIDNRNDNKEQMEIVQKQEVKKLKILIAEDEEVSFKHLSIILKNIGKEILHAKTGIEAIELFQKNPDIDLVLMDIKMPIMGGHEATRKIREFNKDVIIIAQTAYALEGDKEKALEAGCDDYISKPINKDELLEKIRRLVK
ncbi:MAG: PAS domain S-box protein [Saprospiraceae bacterium]|nr:PAS domain S-box protein [Saprospiraceae bacterium]